MQIAGFQPLTLSDYPGRVAAIVFLQGCNFRCPFCHNGALIPPGECAAPIAKGELLAKLSAMRGKIQGVVVTGGEPTIAADLPAFLREIRARGFLVKLDTNGSNPAMLEALLAEKLVDFIAMDIKANWKKYSLLAGKEVDLEKIKRSVEIISASGLPHQFRTTRVKQLLDAADCEALKAQLPASSPHIFQTFIADHALDRSLKE